jgi:hypothetical protein
MVDTFTANLRLRKPEVAANEDAWAALLNDGLIQLIDDAIASEVVADVTAGNVALTEVNGATDTSRRMFIRAIGTPGVNRFIFTGTALTASSIYILKNDSDDTIGIGPVPGVALTVQPGQIVMFYVEPGAGAFEVLPSGSFVLNNTGTHGSLTIDIQDGPDGTGDQQVNARFLVQGQFVVITFEEFLANNFTGGALRFLPVGGTWPASIQPADGGAFAANIYEDTGGGMTLVRCKLQQGSVDVTPWSFDPVIGGQFTIGSDRQMLHSMTIMYPLVSNT